MLFRKLIIVLTLIPFVVCGQVRFDGRKAFRSSFTITRGWVLFDGNHSWKMSLYKPHAFMLRYLPGPGHDFTFDTSLFFYNEANKVAFSENEAPYGNEENTTMKFNKSLGVHLGASSFEDVNIFSFSEDDWKARSKNVFLGLTILHENQSILFRRRKLIIGTSQTAFHFDLIRYYESSILNLTDEFEGEEADLLNEYGYRIYADHHTYFGYRNIRFVLHYMIGIMKGVQSDDLRIPFGIGIGVSIGRSQKANFL